MKRKYCEACELSLPNKNFKRHILSNNHKKKLISNCTSDDGIKVIKQAFRKRLQTAIIENEDSEIVSLEIFLDKIKPKILSFLNFKR